MFIFKDTSDLWKSEFKKNRLFRGSKYKKLKKHYSYQDLSETYTWNAFKKMIDTLDDPKKSYKILRVYLARYNGKQVTSPFPLNVKKNKLILLFSPGNKNVLPDHYYFINENDDQLYTIDKGDADKWLKLFSDSDLHVIRKTIKKHDDDDYYGGVHSDTKFIWYPKENIDSAFKVEYHYQDSAYNVEISAVQMTFSAYPRQGKKPDVDGHKYKRRLFVQFDYMKKNSQGKDEVFYLDNEPDFCCRLQNSHLDNKSELTESVIKISNIEKATAVDNGQLCPTVCN